MIKTLLVSRREEDQSMIAQQHTRRVPKRFSNFCPVVLIAAGILLGPLNDPGFRPAAAADKFPGKPITVLCGYGAGGSSDVQIRTVAPYVQKHLNQPIVVENLPGVSGVLASNKAFSLEPDGYTLLVSCPQQLVLSEHMYKEAARYRTMDWTFIHSLIREDPMLVSHPDLYKSFEEFSQAAQKKKLKVGIPGKYQLNHLLVVQIERLAKVSFNIIPFEGGGPGMSSVMGKHIDAFMTTGSTAFNMIRAGNLRALLVMGKTRSPQYPQVPIPADFGYDTRETEIILFLQGIYAPPNMPRDRAEILQTAFSRALKDPEYLEKLNNMHIEVYPIPGEKFRHSMEQEYPSIMKFMEIMRK
jgi:tripartite-type tricarboxylate transporter receptor subunit TctC